MNNVFGISKRNYLLKMFKVLLRKEYVLLFLSMRDTDSLGLRKSAFSRLFKISKLNSFCGWGNDFTLNFGAMFLCYFKIRNLKKVLKLLSEESKSCKFFYLKYVNFYGYFVSWERFLLLSSLLKYQVHLLSYIYKYLFRLVFQKVVFFFLLNIFYCMNGYISTNRKRVS